MHVVMFSLRRAFHKSAEVGLRLTAEFGLTPSRLDLMLAVVVAGARGSVRQVELGKLLGVSAPNVSRMVTSLEKLGFVRRRRDENGRTCGVRLTDLGRVKVKVARRALIRGGAAHRAVKSFFPAYPFQNKRAAKRMRTTTLEGLVDSLGRMRRALKDRAVLTYSIREPDGLPTVGWCPA